MASGSTEKARPEFFCGNEPTCLPVDGAHRAHPRGAMHLVGWLGLCAMEAHGACGEGKPAIAPPTKNPRISDSLLSLPASAA